MAPRGRAGAAAVAAPALAALAALAVAALAAAGCRGASEAPDPRLRRPYLVEVAVSAGEAARDLAAFLRQREIQALLATFGKGKYDDQPLFFPVVVPPS